MTRENKIHEKAIYKQVAKTNRSHFICFAYAILLVSALTVGCGKEQNVNFFIDGQVSSVKSHYKIIDMIWVARMGKARNPPDEQDMHNVSKEFDDAAYRILMTAAVHAVKAGDYESAENYVYKSLNMKPCDARSLSLALALSLRHGDRYEDNMKEDMEKFSSDVAGLNNATRLLMRVSVGDQVADDDMANVSVDSRWYINFIRDLRNRINYETQTNGNANEN